MTSGGEEEKYILFCVLKVIDDPCSEKLIRFCDINYSYSFHVDEIVSKREIYISTF